MTKKEATKIRRELDAQGYDRVSGSGRGTSWTRHTKAGEPVGVFVQKRYGVEEWTAFTFTR